MQNLICVFLALLDWIVLWGIKQGNDQGPKEHRPHQGEKPFGWGKETQTGGLEAQQRGRGRQRCRSAPQQAARCLCSASLPVVPLVAWVRFKGAAAAEGLR